ncbi:RNA polymerase sigma factor [Prolixibacteraceae bacterium JC049]|nr:RNA polymerase sigma factor [Prolixibacteraceae bacterium JC049]
MVLFEEIYSEYYFMVNRFSVRMTGEQNTADDITQEVFLDLYHQLKAKKEIRSMKSWLFRIAANKSINHMRKLGKIELTENNTPFEKLIEPEREYELTEELNESIQQLEEQDQVLLALYSEGLSYKEIAEVTGIKVTSVGKTLSRALSRLRKTFKHNYHELFSE